MSIAVVVTPISLLVVALAGLFAQKARKAVRHAFRRAKPAFPESVLARLRAPLPGVPRAASPLTAEEVRSNLQFGKLRFMSRVEEEGDLQETLRKYHVTVVSHTAPSGVDPAYTFVREDIPRIQAALRKYHECGVVTLPYCDYANADYTKQNGFFLNWSEYRKLWKPVFGPVPSDIRKLLEIDCLGNPVEPYKLAKNSLGQSQTRYYLSPDAPHALARALLCTKIELHNGADGVYWDNQNYHGGDFGPCGARAFRGWLEENFTPARRRELFGTDNMAQLTLAKALPPRKALGALEPKDIAPLTMAFLRFHTWRQGWLREQIVAFGRSINPNFVMTGTFWSWEGSPYYMIFGHGIEIGEVSKDGNRDSMIFWEPEERGPERGNTFVEAKARAGRKRKSDAALPPDFQYGRRSYSAVFKQMTGASYVPVVSKMLPPAGFSHCREFTELLYAEAYSNLASMRTLLDGKNHSPEGILRMHSFQAAHPDLFVGSVPYSRVALLCSAQQAYACRIEGDSVAFSRKLTDMKLEHQIIPDRMVTPEALKAFDMLILFNDALLTDNQMVAIETFKKDRTLVALGQCGTHDEWLRPRAKGVRRLVGDLVGKGGHDRPVVSADGHVVYLPSGALIRACLKPSLRQNNDGDIEILRQAIEKSAFGQEWPYIANHSEFMEIHLASIPKRSRLVAHLVNYNVARVAAPPATGEAAGANMTGRAVATPTAPLDLAVRVYGPNRPTRATLYAPDAAQGRPLELKIVERKDAAYAVVPVPPVRIYAIIALD
jgi:hypothetical protein